VVDRKSIGNKTLISIVVPVYYNAESLKELYTRLCKLPDFDKSIELEIVFVDDGSGDNSFDIIRDIALQDNRVAGIKFSRNFGSFVACFAGLSHCAGDCAVIISADLQDPPELIGLMHKKWQQGNKVVIAVRDGRREGFLTIFFAKIFYRVFRLLVTKSMPKEGFDFVLIDRHVIDILTSMQEKNTTIMGLILWMGFKRAEVTYTRMERKKGRSRWTLLKKINYFIDSIMAFSQVPIRAFTIIGIFSIGFSIAGIFYIILAYMVGWLKGIPGWPSLMIINLFMFGMLFSGLGILGEYVWRNLEETRKRPVFIIDAHHRSIYSKHNEGAGPK